MSRQFILIQFNMNHDLFNEYDATFDLCSTDTLLKESMGPWVHVSFENQIQCYEPMTFTGYQVSYRL